jgi:hypothetical protein
VIDELMAPSSSPGHRWSCLSHSKQARRSKIGTGERNCELHGRGLACLRRARGTTPSRLRVLVPESQLCRPVHIVHASREAPGHGGTEARRYECVSLGQKTCHVGISSCGSVSLVRACMLWHRHIRSTVDENASDCAARVKSGLWILLLRA